MLNHVVSYTSAQAVDVSYALSIKVAAPQAQANTKNQKIAAPIDKKAFAIIITPCSHFFATRRAL